MVSRAEEKHDEKNELDNATVEARGVKNSSFVRLYVERIA